MAKQEKQTFNREGDTFEVFINHESASIGGNDTPSEDPYSQISCIMFKGVDVSDIIDPEIIGEIEKSTGYEFDYK